MAGQGGPFCSIRPHARGNSARLAGGGAAFARLDYERQRHLAGMKSRFGDWSVRTARKDDLSAILRVCHRAWHATYGGVLSESAITDTLNQWYSPEAMVRRVTSEDNPTAVVERNNRIEGYI